MSQASLLTPSLAPEREHPAKRPIPVTPMTVSLLRWLHGPAAADELIRKATAR